MSVCHSSNITLLYLEMDNITLDELLYLRPNYPEHTKHDEFFLDLANRLLHDTIDLPYREDMPEDIAKRMALTLTGYMEDILADAGLWRSFIEECRYLYGYTLPFYEVSDDYVDYELNREDIRFLVWYVTATLWQERRLISPYDEKLLEYADRCYEILDMVYDDAPVAEGYPLARNLSFKDPEDTEELYDLSRWLFLHSYLLTPAFGTTLAEIISEIDMNDPEGETILNKRLEEAMFELPTGPLALYTTEWLHLLVEGGHVKPQENHSDKIHPYYEKFCAGSAGKEIMFFDRYDKMNDFFIDTLGWEKGKEHLDQVKGADDYILMVNREKGMLMACNIARCVNTPDNPYYDPDYAKEHAITLLTDRGRCPGDLLQMIFRQGWLTDALFVGSSDPSEVSKHQDLIARCFLQLYYRGD